MFTQQTECPVCSTPVTDWSSRCPKCRYHPDCYNRAQDDVAMLARFQPWPRDPAPAPAAGSGWRRFLPAWMGGHSAGGAPSTPA